MTEQAWRAVFTITLRSERPDQALRTRLTPAVQALDVVASVVERPAADGDTSVRRAFQRAGTQSARVTGVDAGDAIAGCVPAASWGFFIVERPAEDGQHDHIQVFLYPDTS